MASGLRRAPGDRPSGRSRRSARSRATSAGRRSTATTPSRWRERFADAGAAILHVVDLDGARAGEPTPARRRRRDRGGRRDAARRSRRPAGSVRCATSTAAFGAGAGRVVLGTAALQDPGLVRDAVAAHGPESIAVAVDVRDGRAVGDAGRAPPARCRRRDPGDDRRRRRDGSRSPRSTATASSAARTSRSSMRLGRLGGGRLIASAGIGTSPT